MSDSFNIQKWRYNLMLEALEKETQEQIDELIPKIKRIDFSYTDYGSLYKIRIYGSDGNELYIVGDDDDLFKYNRLNDDGIIYVAKKLKIPVTDQFADRYYDFDYYESVKPAFKAKGIELTHDDAMDVSEGTCGYDTDVESGKKLKSPGGLRETIKNILKTTSLRNKQ